MARKRTDPKAKDFYCVDVMTTGGSVSSDCEFTSLKNAREHARYESKRPGQKGVMLRRSAWSRNGSKDISWWENGKGSRP